MKAIRKAAPLSVLGAGLVVALTIVALGLSGGLERAHGQDPDGVITGIDMDPTGNTATTLGTIDRCRAVSPGDVIQIDVFVSDLEDPPGCTVGGTPFCESISSSRYDLMGWPASGNDAAAPRITAQNNRLFLDAAPASIVVDFSDTVPDGTDPHLVSIVDLGAAEYPLNSFHQGLIGRYTFDTHGAAAGLYELTLENVAHIRDIPPGALVPNKGILDANFTPAYGLIAVGVPCATSVGGLAELPQVAGDSGSSTGAYAPLAGGLAAAAVALTAGGWYARRRGIR